MAAVPTSSGYDADVSMVHVAPSSDDGQVEPMMDDDDDDDDGDDQDDDDDDTIDQAQGWDDDHQGDTSDDDDDDDDDGDDDGPPVSAQTTNASAESSSSSGQQWRPRHGGHVVSALDVDFLDMRASLDVLLAMGAGDVMLSNQQQHVRMSDKFKQRYFHLAGAVFVRNEWRDPLAAVLRAHHDVHVQPPGPDGAQAFCVKGCFIMWHQLHAAMERTWADHGDQGDGTLAHGCFVRIVMRGSKMSTDHFRRQLLPYALPGHRVSVDFGRRVDIAPPNDDDHHAALHGDDGPWVTLVHADVSRVHHQRFKTKRYALFGALAKQHYGGVQLDTRSARHSLAARFCPHGRVSKITIYSKHEHVLRAVSARLGLDQVPSSVTMLRRKRATLKALMRRLRAYDGRHVQGMRFESRITFQPVDVLAVIAYMDRLLRPSGVDTVAAVPPGARSQLLRRGAHRAVRGGGGGAAQSTASSQDDDGDDDDDAAEESSSVDGDHGDHDAAASSSSVAGPAAPDDLPRVLSFQRIPVRMIHQQLRYFLKLARTRACLYRGENAREPSYGQKAQYVELLAMFGHVLYKYEKWAGSVMTWTDRANALHWSDVCSKRYKMEHDARLYAAYRASVLRALEAYGHGAAPTLLQPVVVRWRPADRARCLLKAAVRQQYMESRAFQERQVRRRQQPHAAADAAQVDAEQADDEQEEEEPAPPALTAAELAVLGYNLDNPDDPTQPPIHVLAEAIEAGDHWIADILAKCVVMVRKNKVGQVGLRRRRPGAFLWADGWGAIADRLREKRKQLANPRRGVKPKDLTQRRVWKRLLATKKHDPPPDDDSQGGDDE